MTPRNEIADRNLLNNVTQKLERIGAGSLGEVTATVSTGDVTLAGTVEHEHRRRSILRSIGSIRGVRTVIDKLRVESDSLDQNQMDWSAI